MFKYLRPKDKSVVIGINHYWHIPSDFLCKKIL